MKQKPIKYNAESIKTCSKTFLTSNHLANKYKAIIFLSFKPNNLE